MKTLASLLNAAKCKPVPKGWQTLEEIRKQEGKSLNHTRLILREAVEAGLVKVQPWPIPMRNGVARPTPIYRRVSS